MVALAAYGTLTVPGDLGLDPAAVFAASAVSSESVLLVSVAVGAYAAPRVDLRSHLLARVAGDRRPERSMRSQFPLAAGLGAATGIVFLAASEAFVPYGGVTEELLLRFGLLALFAFVGHRLLGRDREVPSGRVMWGAVALSALAFGLGHLPATAAVVELTPAVVARGLVLNGLGGVVFGWLYWRRSLEAAMVAHVALHVVLVAASVVVVL